MVAANLGWFGKLPMHGDFLHRRLSPAFVSTWDEWLQRCMTDSKQALGEDWLKIYLTSPVWRFFLSEGVVKSATYAGIVAPSVDRVGRYFPLTIAVELPTDLSPMAVAIYAREWLQRIETIALQVLEEDEMDIERFDANVQESAELLRHVERYTACSLGETFPTSATHWRLPMFSSDRVAASLIDPLMDMVGRQLRPLSMWWSDGSERVSPTCLLSRALPDTKKFVSLLTGEWQAAGWCGQFGDVVDAAAARFDYATASAASSISGPVRAENQDRYLSSPEPGIWAVADGMGGHSRGEEASQLVVDVLAALEPAATMSAALQAVRLALSRANADLMRGSSKTGLISGSTVVVLIVRQHEWAVLWAGDSRAYLLREEALTPLSRDHVVTDELGAGESGQVTRAVGGHETLRMDTSIGELRPGDRFMLCSDGLHNVLPEECVRTVLTGFVAADAAVQRLLEAAIERQSTDNITAAIVDIVGHPVEASKC